MTNEQICTQFMQDQYTDEKLAALLAHAEDGKLAFISCCCFVGTPSADHMLTEEWVPCPTGGKHLSEARALYSLQEDAYLNLGPGDRQCRASIIPLIKAEIARRDAIRESNQRLLQEDKPETELMVRAGCFE